MSQIPRCCGSSACNCKVVEGRLIQVSGIGTTADPLVIDNDAMINPLVNDTFTVVLGGSGSLANPWTLEVIFSPEAGLDHIPDVEAPTPENGQVLAWSDAAGAWTPAPPMTWNGTSTRTNIVLNPSFEVDTDGWDGNNATIARVATGGSVDSSALEVTTLTTGPASADADTMWTDPGFRFPVTAGEVYTVQARAKAITVDRSFVVTVYWWDAAGTAIDNDAGTGVMTNTATYITSSLTATAPTGATSASLRLSFMAAEAGEEFLIDAVMMEKSGTLDPYFDGASTDTAETSYYWTGTPHLSASSATTTTDIGFLTGDGLSGDGTGVSPLEVVGDADRHIQVTATGVGLTDNGMNRLNRTFVDSAQRDAAVPAVTIGTISTLLTDPGRLEYWTGTEWLPIDNGTGLLVQSELMQLSGPYAGGRVYDWVDQISAVTDGNGDFDILATADISTYAGVLTAQFQETGTTAWRAVVQADTVNDKIVGRAFRLTDGTALVGFTATGTVRAMLY